MWQPTASQKTLKARAELLQLVRTFFNERQVLEVQTPVITSAGVTDIHIDSIALSNSSGFLRTSPEYFHKRLLANGVGDLYELGPVFRQAESGRHHQPEFYLLEWYRLGWDYRQLADETIQLLQTATVTTSKQSLEQWPVQCYDYAELCLKYCGMDLITTPESALSNKAAELGLVGEHPRGVMLDFLFSQLVQAELPANTIHCVFDYPASQAALAKTHPQKPERCQRFEIYLGNVELANGYQELTDAQELRSRFERDNQQRLTIGKSPMPIDEALLQAMTQGLPDCAGVALGFDRWLQILLQLDSVAKTQAFPTS